MEQACINQDEETPTSTSFCQRDHGRNVSKWGSKESGDEGEHTEEKIEGEFANLRRGIGGVKGRWEKGKSRVWGGREHRRLVVRRCAPDSGFCVVSFFWFGRESERKNGFINIRVLEHIYISYMNLVMRKGSCMFACVF